MKGVPRLSNTNTAMLLLQSDALTGLVTEARRLLPAYRGGRAVPLANVARRLLAVRFVPTHSVSATAGFSAWN